jgi:uncharacterized membrane protein
MSRVYNFVPREIILVLFLAVILNILRLLIFKSDSFVWLLWNLFLALIPFIVSSLLLFQKSNGKLTDLFFIFGLFIWLLFLPNAPYIITDLIHINVVKSVPVLYDSLLLFATAWVGLYLGLYSIFHIEKILLTKYKERMVDLLILIIIILTSFGIYLGRFLRFNSWDIFTRPFFFSDKLIKSLSGADSYTEALIYTILFSFFLYIFYKSWKSIKIK